MQRPIRHPGVLPDAVPRTAAQVRRAPRPVRLPPGSHLLVRVAGTEFRTDLR
ncbi:hypothetical protein [Cellulomonas carbonis]|uniref:hypothetical protein n=1 Tax=Cellulomonas carbonis TaxID=1386092 RepID=UPI000B03EFDD|nr:hypothetical protein [Cellulomonas carbonis]GGC02459.1 hypothetical protein GCM10010972_14250 [Cellulomonas carbonis]